MTIRHALDGTSCQRRVGFSTNIRHSLRRWSCAMQVLAVAAIGFAGPCLDAAATTTVREQLIDIRVGSWNMDGKYQGDTSKWTAHGGVASLMVNPLDPNDDSPLGPDERFDILVLQECGGRPDSNFTEVDSGEINEYRNSFDRVKWTMGEWRPVSSGPTLMVLHIETAPWRANSAGFKQNMAFVWNPNSVRPFREYDSLLLNWKNFISRYEANRETANSGSLTPNRATVGLTFYRAGLPGRPFIVYNVHADPDAGNQVPNLLSAIEQDAGMRPFMVLGDFNRDVHEYVVDDAVSQTESYPDWYTLSEVGRTFRWPLYPDGYTFVSKSDANERRAFDYVFQTQATYETNPPSSHRPSNSTDYYRLDEYKYKRTTALSDHDQVAWMYHIEGYCAAGRRCTQVGNVDGFEREFIGWVDMVNWSQCTDQNPCPAHAGDCDQDSHCTSDAQCGSNTGPAYGLHPALDTCVPRHYSGNCNVYSEPFGWSCRGRLYQRVCIAIREPSDPDAWHDNYFCSTENIGMRWSYAGKLPGMDCTQIREAADPHTWNDNYLCVPWDSGYKFSWSSHGPIAGKHCIQWSEPSDPHTWNDNYLCWE